jgi:ribosome-binding protein aMBF1 (putative translation factor)
MSNILTCDWCRQAIEEQHHRVSLDGTSDLDCCNSCFRGVAPKPKVGRPRGKKTPATAMAQAPIVDPGATS